MHASQPAEVSITITKAGPVEVRVYRCPENPAAALRCAQRESKALPPDSLPDIQTTDDGVLLSFFVERD